MSCLTRLLQHWPSTIRLNLSVESIGCSSASTRSSKQEMRSILSIELFFILALNRRRLALSRRFKKTFLLSSSGKLNSIWNLLPCLGRFFLFSTFNAVFNKTTNKHVWVLRGVDLYYMYVLLLLQLSNSYQPLMIQCENVSILCTRPWVTPFYTAPPRLEVRNGNTLVIMINFVRATKVLNLSCWIWNGCFNVI